MRITLAVGACPSCLGSTLTASHSCLSMPIGQLSMRLRQSSNLLAVDRVRFFDDTTMAIFRSRFASLGDFR